MIQTKNLKKVFSKDQEICFSDFTLPEKHILFIDGPSGSGKTTLMKILAQLDNSYSGEFSTHVNKKEVGYFFHDYKFIKDLSIYENIIFGNIHKNWSTQKFEERKREIQNLAKKLGVKDRLSTPIHKLSAGEYQRFCLVRAFVGEKKIIFLDEPISHLDSQTAKTVYTLIYEYYKRGTTFCISSHNRELFTFLSETIGSDTIISLKF